MESLPVEKTIRMWAFFVKPANHRKSNISSRDHESISKDTSKYCLSSFDNLSRFVEI